MARNQKCLNRKYFRHDQVDLYSWQLESKTTTENKQILINVVFPVVWNLNNSRASIWSCNWKIFTPIIFLTIIIKIMNFLQVIVSLHRMHKIPAAWSSRSDTFDCLLQIVYEAAVRIHNFPYCVLSFDKFNVLPV